MKASGKRTEKWVARAWLKGFTDGEGYVTKSTTQTGNPSARMITIANTDPAIIQQAVEYLDLLGFRYYVKTRKMVNRKDIAVIIISHQENLIKWRDLIGFTSKRKQESLDKLVSEYNFTHFTYNPEKIKMALDLRKKGMSYSKIAKELGCCIGTAYHAIKKGALRYAT